MDYTIDKPSNTITIKNIVRTTWGYLHQLDGEHIGTELFSEMLIDLYFKYDIIPSKINGWLSSRDQENRNWLKSIPFYIDYVKYVPKKLPYKLDFHLYEADKEKKEIIIPSKNRMEFVESLVYGEEVSLLFCYNVTPKI